MTSATLQRKPTHNQGQRLVCSGVSAKTWEVEREMGMRGYRETAGPTVLTHARGTSRTAGGNLHEGGVLCLLPAVSPGWASPGRASMGIHLTGSQGKEDKKDRNDDERGLQDHTGTPSNPRGGQEALLLDLLSGALEAQAAVAGGST